MVFPSRLAATDPAADLAACKALLRHGSRSFHAASLLLPARVRDPSVALYAFCRLADDAVDCEGGLAPAVARLRERLARAYDGRPASHPADRALAEVVAQFGMPRTLPEALLEGLAWDAEGRRYDNLSSLLDYAARVAGAVGAMMAVLMGARDAVASACDLGVAMQLTNIARDVGEDARAGRLYLPRDWLREAGIDPERFLARPEPSAAISAVIARLLAVADSLYARGDAGIARLPAACRPGIFAARLLYAEIGREVERRGYDSVTQRAVVPGRRKLGLLARAVAESIAADKVAMARGLAETRYLVDAVSSAPPPRRTAEAWRGVRGRALWVLDLFEQLARREALARGR
jgi:phytoene synthase